MTDELSAQIQNAAVNSSGSLFGVRGYTPSNYAAGDVYNGEGGSGDIVSSLKKNPVLALILLFVILSLFNRGRYGN